jgi:putative component of membrane protein insertase Oxa1/YidC/SpoIIIJ protein YidD
MSTSNGPQVLARSEQVLAGFLTRAVAKGVAWCIAGYQKHLSPRKGWNCAHRVRRGGLSCSEFVRRAVLQHGVAGAIPLARERFAQCAAAAGRGSKRAKRKWSCGRWNWDLPSCACHGADVCVDCGPGDSGCADCNPCS